MAGNGRFDVRDHHMWWPAMRVALSDKAMPAPDAAAFADWFIANRWQDNVREALDDYLKTQGKD